MLIFPTELDVPFFCLWASLGVDRKWNKYILTSTKTGTFSFFVYFISIWSSCTTVLRRHITTWAYVHFLLGVLSICVHHVPSHWKGKPKKEVCTVVWIQAGHCIYTQTDSTVAEYWGRCCCCDCCKNKKYILENTLRPEWTKYWH